PRGVVEPRERRARQRLVGVLGAFGQVLRGAPLAVLGVRRRPLVAGEGGLGLVPRRLQLGGQLARWPRRRFGGGAGPLIHDLILLLACRLARPRVARRLPGCMLRHAFLLTHRPQPRISLPSPSGPRRWPG